MRFFHNFHTLGYVACINPFHFGFGIRQGSVLSPCLFVVYLDDLTSSCSSLRGLYIVLYADDILLIAPSTCGLQNLLRICEHKLVKIDMVANTRKSSCLRISPRHNNRCLSVSLSTGDILWMDEIRYLGVFIARF